MKDQSRPGLYQRWLSPEGYLGLHLVIGFFVALIAGLLFRIVAEEVFGVPGILSVDSQARQIASSIASDRLTFWMRSITIFGSWYLLLIVSIATGIFLFYRHSRRRLYTFAAITAAGPFLNWLLKYAYQRARPFGEPLVIAHGYSFPSGHAMGSLLVFAGLAYVLFFTSGTHRIARLLAIFACLIVPVLVGASRIYLGVHYFSDVIAGYFAALCWIGICVSGTEGWIRLRTLKE